MKAFARRHLHRALLLALTGVLYSLSVPSTPSLSYADAFRFEAVRLEPADNGVAMRSVRAVHPSLQHIDAWISSVGAGVAIADISGTGLPADICLVDPRNDSVTVMPAPGTGERFDAFVLSTPTEGYVPGTIAPMGCLPLDANEDGATDLLVYYWGRTPLVFLADSSERFASARFRPMEILPARERWNTNAALAADFDGDGHLDLMFGNYFRDGARVLDPNARDAFEMQHSMSRAYNAGANHLLLWKSASAQTVGFEEARDVFEPIVPAGWTLALGAADLNGDLLPELYIANDFGPDHLLLNRSSIGRVAFERAEGRRGLATPRSKVLGRDSFKGMGVDFADLAGAGRPAIAVSNISAPYSLLESHFLFVHTGDEGAWARGEAPYVDRSAAYGTWTSGWGWDLKFADLTNSGTPALLQAIGFVQGGVNRWPELIELSMANDELLKQPWAWHRISAGDDVSGQDHDRLFAPGPDGRYHDIWLQLGLDRATVSRGIAVGDVYGDGRLAVAIARQWMPSLFLRNVSPGAGRAISLDLRVPGAVGGTRPAVGAVAQVRLANGRRVASWIDGGSGHSGKRAPEIHLGLGDAPAGSVHEVDIAWRDAAGIHRQSVSLAAGRHRLILNAPAQALEPSSASLAACRAEARPATISAHGGNTCGSGFSPTPARAR